MHRHLPYMDINPTKCTLVVASFSILIERQHLLKKVTRFSRGASHVRPCIIIVFSPMLVCGIEVYHIMEIYLSKGDSRTLCCNTQHIPFLRNSKYKKAEQILSGVCDFTITHNLKMKISWLHSAHSFR